MNEKINLLLQLDVARRLLAAPSKLTGKELKQYRSIVDNIGDRCQFNCGWHAAQPAKHLPGAASTEKVSADLQTLTKALLSHALPPKRPKAGRPPKEKKLDLPYLFVIADFVSHQGSKTMLECVRAAVQRGWLDKTTADTTHLRRIDRSAKKALQESNVIPFPKSPRTPNKN
jgi:hypothetical protein